MTDVYQAPAADFSQRTVPFGGSGSIASGVAGNYDLPIGGIISEAWASTKGIKGTVWLAVVLYIVVLGIFAGLLNYVLRWFGLSYVEGDPKEKMVAFQLLSQGLQMFVTMPLWAGMAMLGIKLAVRAPVEATEIFAYFKKVLPLIGTMLLMYLMIIIGFCLLILPGIYLTVAYFMAMPLVVEKNLGPWEALEVSRKAITHHWFKLFGLYFVFGLIFILSMIPLFIGMIWTLPMSVLLTGIVYRTIFGFEGNISADQSAN